MKKEMIWEAPSNIINIAVSGAGGLQGVQVAEVAWLTCSSQKTCTLAAVTG